MLRIYIAGKITGLNHDATYIKFDQAETKMKAMGFEVVNPMNIVPAGTDWKLAMKLCLRSLVTCDAIFLLDDWKDSEGANLELHIARKLGLKIILNNVSCIQDLNSN